MLHAGQPVRRYRVNAADVALGLSLLLGGLPSLATAQAVSQTAPTALPREFAIPYLANATKPADLDFVAATCTTGPAGDVLSCRFRQLFLTISPIDRAACVITTNTYERAFQRDTGARWTSHEQQGGDCGNVETTTLEDGGGTHWTMSIRTTATIGADRPACRAQAEPEVYDWRTIKRTLPCTSVQPGAIER